MKYIYDSAITLARASKGSPVISTLTVMLFYLMFNVAEAGVEHALYGALFQHWLDPIFSISFIAYSALVVYACAVVNAEKPEH